MACDKLECDYKANKSDHDMVEDYVQRYFTDEKEFLLTFPAAKSCTPPVKKKPAKKPAPSVKTKAKTEVKTKAKTDVKTKAKTTATPKTKPTPKPTPKKVTPQEN
jgi:hypothetical protein